MAFQRNLTGSSNLYANIVLNTNISADTVSTNYLSATNASFVNMTTNTWQAGSVSTPNVIATSGYFSNIYMSNFNASNANISNLSTVNISSTSINASNVSSYTINSSTATAYITNVSTQNSCLVATSTIYSTYGYVSNFSVSNLDIKTENVSTLNASLINACNIVVPYNGCIDVDGTILSNYDIAEYQNIKNAGGNTVYQMYNNNLSRSIVHNISNNATDYIDFKRNNADLMRLSTSQVFIYNPLYVSSIGVCTVSVSSISMTTTTGTSATITTMYSTVNRVGTIHSSTGNFSTINVSTFSPANISTDSISVTNGYISNLSVGSLSISGGNMSNMSLENLSVSTKATITNISATNISATNITGTFSINTCYATLWRTYASEVHATDVNISSEGALIFRNTSGIINFAQYVSDSLTPHPTMINYGFALDKYQFHVSDDSIALYFDKNNICAMNSSLYVSYISAKKLYISNISVSNLTMTSIGVTTGNISNLSSSNISSTTITGTTANFSTLNVSTFAPTNMSLTNFSVNTSATMLNTCISTLFVSNINFIANTSNSSVYGAVAKSGTQMTILCSTAQCSTITLQTNSTARMEIGTTGISSYVSFYVSKAFVSTLSVCVFSPGTVTTSTVNTCTLNVCNFNPATITTSTVNACSLNVCTFNPASITTSTINVCDLYASTGNFSNLNVSTFTPNNISVTNLSVANIFQISNISSTSLLAIRNDGVVIRDKNTSGTAYFALNIDSDSFGGEIYGLILEADETQGAVIDSGYNLPLTIALDGLPQLYNTCAQGFQFYNKINNSFQTNLSNAYINNLSVDTLNLSTGYVSTLNSSTETTGTLNATTINVSTLNASTETTGTLNATTINTSTINASTGTIVTMNNTTLNVSTFNNSTANIRTLNTSYINPSFVSNTINCSVTSTPMTLFANTTNVCGAGIRLPNYIDAVDTGSGLTIGANQTAGFINVCRGCRFYSNILTGSNINGINATDSIILGNNITTGDLGVGNSGMTGNITIATGGDCIFQCDRRSEWNTSDIIKCSTQIGSFYTNGAVTTGTKTTTGQTMIFAPLNANTSLTPVPVGLYLINVNGYIRTNSSYNASITGANVGMCLGSGYDFSTGNTTRTALNSYGNMGDLSNTSGAVVPFAGSGVLNVTTTGNYVGCFMSVTTSNAATVGNLTLQLVTMNVTKIA